VLARGGCHTLQSRRETTERGGIVRVLHWVREEVRKVRAGFLFFAGMFSLIVVTEHILGRTGSEVVIPGFARAIIGGLIAAKVMLIVDALPFTERYQGRPLVYAILWKSALYFLMSQVLAFLEPLARTLFHGRGLAAAYEAGVDRFREPRTWVIALWVAFMILAFVTGRELSRALGTGTVRKMIWNR
jgi:hypothetical protein